MCDKAACQLFGRTFVPLAMEPARKTLLKLAKELRGDECLVVGPGAGGGAFPAIVTGTNKQRAQRVRELIGPECQTLNMCSWRGLHVWFDEEGALGDYACPNEEISMAVGVQLVGVVVVAKPSLLS